MKLRNGTRRLTVIGMLLGINLLLTLTNLGIISIPPVGFTIMHIPVIVCVILEGPVAGLIVALTFAFASMYKAYTVPMPTSFIFMNPLIAVLPRLLIPIVTWACLKLQKNRGTKISVGIAAAAGSLTNTIGVLGMIYILYAKAYAQALNIPDGALLGALGGIAATNGLIEAAVCVAVSIGVAAAVRKSFSFT